MKKSFFLNSDTVKFLVTSSGPGVFGFINFIEKKVWISYSENVTEAIVRNIKLIETRQHKIRKMDGWDICVFERSENKASAKKNFQVYCKSYRSKGLEVLNKEFNVKIWGEIARDFRDPSKFLYYIWAGTTSAKRSASLAIFEQAQAGEEYLKNFKKGKVGELSPMSRRLVIEYKKLDMNKQQYQRLFGNEAL